MVKAAVRVSSGVPPFVFLSLSGFPLGAGRKGSVVGGAQSAFSSRRTGAGSPGRAFALAAQKPGAGRGRWAGRRGAAGFRGGGLFPRRQRQFRSGRAKKQATKRRTKKDFPSPKRRRFVKTGFSARYKEARRSGRSRGRKSPRPGKGDRRCRLSRFAVRNSQRRGRLWGGPPKGARNLWKPQAGDRRALSRDFPTNSGPGVSSSKT